MLETNVDGLLLLGVSMTYSSTVGNVDDNLDRGRDCLGETGYWPKLLLTPPPPPPPPPVTNTDVCTSPPVTNTDVYMHAHFGHDVATGGPSEGFDLSRRVNKCVPALPP